MCGFWGFGGHSFLWLLILIGCLIFFFNRNRFCFSRVPEKDANVDLSKEVAKLRQEIDLLRIDRE